ncbi:MAG: response regulator [Desulfosarcinaceae bacterium]|jgi:putative nucleotidyltransferase with HDIG domain
MRRILFVDDEPNVLKGMQRMLRGMRKEWEMHFVDSGAAALEMLAASEFDVIVSDMRMPVMDGAELLSQVRDRYPEMVRMVLSAYADHKAIMRTVRLAHQYIAKPCDAEILKSTIDRSFTLKQHLDNEQLRCLISKMDSIPGLPDTYARITELLGDPDTSIQAVAKVFGEDIGMTVKILQLVNSAFYGLARKVTSAEEAAVYLGIDTIRALVLTIGIFSGFEEGAVPRQIVEDLYQHSTKTGALAKAIAAEEGLEKDQMEEAFMAGLLHDLGKLVMVHNMPNTYGRLLRATLDRNLPIHTAEMEIFGATHEQIGAYLAGLWGLPDAIVEAVAFHHAPERCPGSGFDALGAVHVADAVAHANARAGGASDGQRLSTSYLERCGLDAHYSRWAALSTAQEDP